YFDRNDVALEDMSHFLWHLAKESCEDTKNILKLLSESISFTLFPE
ncbi:hypothetical protein DBR06_SOUSAS19810023, partial [Sousa chinensis]